MKWNISNVGYWIRDLKWEPGNDLLFSKFNLFAQKTYIKGLEALYIFGQKLDSEFENTINLLAFSHKMVW